jgi:hypothetical protein
MRKMTRGILAALALGLSACASAHTRESAMLVAVQSYNDGIRWQRPERSMPFVHPDKVAEFRDWSEEYPKKFEVQSWRVREVTFNSKITATVEIERTGFSIPRYVEETRRIAQTWMQDDDLGWRLREGF